MREEVHSLTLLTLRVTQPEAPPPPPPNPHFIPISLATRTIEAPAPPSFHDPRPTITPTYLPRNVRSSLLALNARSPLCTNESFRPPPTPPPPSREPTPNPFTTYADTAAKKIAAKAAAQQQAAPPGPPTLSIFYHYLIPSHTTPLTRATNTVTTPPSFVCEIHPFTPAEGPRRQDRAGAAQAGAAKAGAAKAGSAKTGQSKTANTYITTCPLCTTTVVTPFTLPVHGLLQHLSCNHPTLSFKCNGDGQNGIHVTVCPGVVESAGGDEDVVCIDEDVLCIDKEGVEVTPRGVNGEEGFFFRRERGGKVERTKRRRGQKDKAGDGGKKRKIREDVREGGEGVGGGGAKGEKVSYTYIGTDGTYTRKAG